MDHLCDNLDRFLINDLDPPRRRQFESHLEQCAVCRQQLETQQRVDSALARVADAPAILPPRLRQDLQSREMSRRATIMTHRNHRRWSVATVAAMVLVAVGLWSWFGRSPKQDVGSRDDGLADNVMAPSQPQASDERPESSGPEVTVAVFEPDRPDPISVRVPTESRNVTLLMVYPVSPSRHREPAPGSSTTDSAGGESPSHESTFPEF